MRKYHPDEGYGKKYGQYALDKNHKAYFELMRRAGNWHKTKIYRIS